MPDKSRTSRNAALFVGVLALTACVPDDPTSKDFSGFQSYRFEQTQGLGFCPNADQVFSAEILRTPEGEVSFTHTVLIKSGPDPQDCSAGVALEAGCFTPQPQPARVLRAAETRALEAAFAELTYHPAPDRICDDLAVDPCVIERHVWDGEAFSDYICGVNRIAGDQRDILGELLTALRDRG